MATTAAMTAPPHPGLLDIDLSFMSMEHERQQECDGEEYDVHDRKSPASFDHGACFVGMDVKSAATCINTIGTERDGNRAGAEADAVGVTDPAQEVNSPNENP